MATKRRQPRQPPKAAAVSNGIDAERWLPFLLIGAALLAYQPVWYAGFIWDDDYYVTQNLTLLDLPGLWRIWFEIGAVPQYYPLVHSVFWIENHLWGLHPLGYHLTNVLLHACAALLLAKLLRRLQIPGAWLAAFLFALHPVAVESVAWVTELKNVLSTVFYLAAGLAYLTFEEGQEHHGTDRWRWYATALLLFVAALLSKTVTCSLPAALLLVRWWKKGRLQLQDVWLLVPFFAIGAGLGLQTAWIEKHSVGAQGARWALTWTDSILVAGRAVWFYAAKLVWPHNLTFIYPRWHIDSTAWWQWLFPVAVAGLGAVLLLGHKRLGRAPLTTFLFFIGTLAPALGFINVYPMRYSFVADHFQYLASLGPITLAAALATQQAHRLANGWPRAPLLCTLGLLGILAALTWRQTWMYFDVETLWRATIDRNPGASIAHNNLGNILVAKGHWQQGIGHLRSAVDLQPDNPEAHDSLGSALLERGEVDEAIAQFREALDIQANQARTHYNLGTALMKKDDVNGAVAAFQEGLRLSPKHFALHNSLGNALLKRAQAREAAVAFRAALQIRPNDSIAHNNLGSALLELGDSEGAAAEYQQAIRFQPMFAEAFQNLRLCAWRLATHPTPTHRNGSRALAIAQQIDDVTGHTNPAVITTMAAALAELGRFPEAVAAAERALALATETNLVALQAEIRQQIALFRDHKPFREQPQRSS